MFRPCPPRTGPHARAGQYDGPEQGAGEAAPYSEPALELAAAVAAPAHQVIEAKAPAAEEESETYVAAGPFPASQTATIAGTIAAGAVLTTTVNDIAHIQS